MKDGKIVLYVFTDPMMGLSYESEPILDRLRSSYAGRIEIRYVMSLLVRDVTDFMLPEERAMDPEEGIRQYCKRLAEIYRSEEAIGGLPIHMEGFCLFDRDHRSSKPLNLAYKAAQLADPEKADAFLSALRQATIVECRPTTHSEEILKAVQKAGIPEDRFLCHYRDGSAEAALDQDLAFARRMGIHSLPAYLFQYGQRAILMQSFAYEDFHDVFSSLVEESGENRKS